MWRVNRRLWQSCSAPYRWKARFLLQPVSLTWTLDKGRRSAAAWGDRSRADRDSLEVDAALPSAGRAAALQARRACSHVDAEADTGWRGSGFKRRKLSAIRTRLQEKEGRGAARLQRLFPSAGREMTHLACARDVLSQSVC